VYIHPTCILGHTCNVQNNSIVGAGTKVGNNCRITNSVIGNNCTIAEDCTLSGNTVIPNTVEKYEPRKLKGNACCNSKLKNQTLTSIQSFLALLPTIRFFLEALRSTTSDKSSKAFNPSSVHRTQFDFKSETVE